MDPKKMDFNELRFYIKDALLRRSDSEPDCRPSLEAEFASLLDMLEEKIGAPNLPGTPRRDDPFATLRSKIGKREKLIVRLEKARRGDPPTSRRAIHRMERQWDELDREIDRLEAEHPYAYLQHEGTWYTSANRTQPSTEIRSRMVKSLRKAVERAFHPATEPTGRVSWRLLPPGESSPEDVHRYYEGLKRQGRLSGYDEERLAKALSLPYDEWLVEAEEFEGYSIFTFAHTSKVLMECFVRGNAIYIIDSDWQYWSKRTKKELQEQQASGIVKRIPHQGYWFARVKQELGIN